MRPNNYAPTWVHDVHTRLWDRLPTREPSHPGWRLHQALVDAQVVADNTDDRLVMLTHDDFGHILEATVALEELPEGREFLQELIDAGLYPYPDGARPPHVGSVADPDPEPTPLFGASR